MANGDRGVEPQKVNVADGLGLSANERVQALLELIRIKDAAKVERRKYEWPVNFGIWSGIGFVTWFLGGMDRLPGGVVCGIASVYFAIWSLYTCRWLPLVMSGHWFDNRYVIHCSEQLAIELLNISSLKEFHDDRAAHREWKKNLPEKRGDQSEVEQHVYQWTMCYSIFTSLLMIMSVIILCVKIKSEPSSSPNGIDQPQQVQLVDQ